MYTEFCLHVSIAVWMLWGEMAPLAIDPRTKIPRILRLKTGED